MFVWNKLFSKKTDGDFGNSLSEKRLLGYVTKGEHRDYTRIRRALIDGGTLVT